MRRTTFLSVFLMSLTIASTRAQTAPARERWTGAWTAPQQRVYANITPPPPGLANATLRQVVRCSIAGKRIRVRLANDFGATELRVAAVHVARPTTRGAIDVATDRALTFAGAADADVPAGSSLWSDPVEFDVPALGDVAVTMRLGAIVADEITMHPGARCTSFAAIGDFVSAPTLDGATTSEHWYYLSAIDVVADVRATAVVAIGDSITDGRGSTTDGNGRWTDALAARLQADPATRHVAVLNAGIGGNCVLHGGLGPTALARFDRDVLAPTNARAVIVFEGVNDLGGARDADAVARQLIAAYGQMVARAHARGMTVIGGTITPFSGSQYDAPEHEAARQTVNAWVRTSGAFDAVADFDAAVSDAGARLRPEFDTGDHLHLNDAGYRAIAGAVDLASLTTDRSPS